jgi:hypothetical protein
MKIRKRSERCLYEYLIGTNRVRRYSEFAELRDRLLKTFPSSEAAMPQLPSKSFFCMYSPPIDSIRHGVKGLTDT